MAREILLPQSSSGELTKNKKPRKHLERSRLGCRTCKSVQNISTVYFDLLTSHRIRKVKCDQKYPLCENCTSTGRRCEGSAIHSFHFVPEDSAKLKRRKWPSPFTILQPGTALSDPRERRAFHFFLNQAAPTISGAFDTGFWTRLVPQLSHAEPAVQKALFTIGQLFDTPLRPVDVNKVALRDIPSNQRRAYTWYGHAVNDLQRTIGRGPQSIALALLSCLLFACIEYQLHNPSCAVVLQQKGIALLETALDGTHDLLLDPASSAILDYVIPFFSRHAMIGATFRHPPPAEWKIDADFYTLHHIYSIKNLDEARVSLYSLMYQAHALIRITWLLHTCPEPPPYIVAEQQEMAVRVDNWREDYLKLCEGVHEPDSDYSALTQYLLMYHSVLKVWIATCTSPFQTAFDAHFASFEDILFRAETLIQMSLHDTEWQSPFAGEMGVVPPLFFVAIKCRHPLLRRRALALLGDLPYWEGIWKVLPTIQILRKFIEVEEEAVPRTARSSTHDHACLLPQEANRIHHVEVLPKVSSRSMSNASIRVLRVEWDLNSQRRVRQDVIALG